ncbi:MAG: bifunctional proline dehydrogenase/L-glutamate gamma-semialdehyde dehydrogenase PutA [Proteobacteria bacterium]|nr:bifunctional proline dehydrogenase/L-glutamate gamma-semialdehyde dehydrogenase PutA [Pseudomonadota bacterium]
MARQAPPNRSPLRDRIEQAYLADEGDAIRRLINVVKLDQAARRRIEDTAIGLVDDLRQARQPGMMETFLAEYGLSTKEGVALMCLAEALLRVPDTLTMDALIQDKIAPADWGRHLGQSGSPLVNASTWALMLTGKVIAPEDAGDWDVATTVRAMIKRVGDPVVRNAVSRSMKVLGHQFVLGRDIGEAVKRSTPNESKGYTYSYDMLGEAAHSADDARRYFLAYSGAITALADHCEQADSRRNPGISVKLSALHPRYEFSQRARAVAELTARTASLAQLAKNANMGFNIDAEEADRLDLSLDIIENVLTNPDLQGWDGFGVVVQAYAPRALFVIDWLNDLAERLDRRIMVRLVKGAYWDSEIKTAQEMGLPGYPVFTRKISTDISYMACARRLLDCAARIYPQFATHNAHTVATVLEMAGPSKDFEFQRLHGMGESLFEMLRRRQDLRCRIYAPVGVHKDLLAYLVRRLLENGANSSFVNQVLDETVAAADLVRDPVAVARRLDAIANPRIPLPADLFGSSRRNSQGWNLADPLALRQLQARRAAFKDRTWTAAPRRGGALQPEAGRPILNPANAADRVGEAMDATPAQVEDALTRATLAVDAWRDRSVEARAACLRRVADLYEENAVELMALAAREAGKTLADCVGEVREAVDFCRYYATESETRFAEDQCRGRGVFLCISPWNFPLAIFTGQVTAALVSGNAVIAKPAEQTPLIANRAVELMHLAGIPEDVLQLLPGDGPTVGGALSADPRIAGVCFTGSTETARIINRAMAQKGNDHAPLIAETGGLNAMIVDSSALPEQAVRDIVAAAFQSAGQRCSALRVLFVQSDIADALVTLLKGAMDQLCIGDPWDLATDIGPVIDAEAKDGIEAHCQAMERDGRLLHKVKLPDEISRRGHFVKPAAYRLQGIEELAREIFGPVLHVVIFEAENLDHVVDSINARGYGLTMGVHTRVDNRVQKIRDRARVGNLYVNRNQIGAVVGVQPFGGEGLSGTGPKAGGPHYLARFTEKPAPGGRARTLARTAIPPSRTGNDFSPTVTKSSSVQGKWNRHPNRRAVLERTAESCPAAIGTAIHRALMAVPERVAEAIELPGPTGESNSLSVHGRGVFLCLGASGDSHRAFTQAALALLLGNGAVVLDNDETPGDGERFAAALTDAGAPAGLLATVNEVSLSDIETAANLAGAVLEQGAADHRAVRMALASRDGPIAPLIDDLSDWRPMLIERVLCIDTTASGGNAALLAFAGSSD